MKRLIVVALGLIALVAVVATASAHKPRIASRVTIAPAFHGRVVTNQPHGRCTRHRLVRLWHRNHGGHVSLVASTHTNRRGRWSIPTHAHKGNYRAHVVRRIQPRVVCLPGTSRRVAVKGG